MPRFKAKRALRKVNPLVANGHRVFIEFSNARAFETRKVERKTGKYGERTYTYTRTRMPSADLLTWLNDTAGPRDVLWHAEKEETGIALYFFQPAHAMMAKLTWSGK